MAATDEGRNVAARDESVEANYGIIFLFKLPFIPEWKGMDSKKDQRQEYHLMAFGNVAWSYLAYGSSEREEVSF